MEFFIKTKPKFKQHFQIGTQLNLSMGEKLIWVTISKIDGENVFFKATGEDEKYLENLFNEKVKSFSIESK